MNYSANDLGVVTCVCYVINTLGSEQHIHVHVHMYVHVHRYMTHAYNYTRKKASMNECEWTERFSHFPMAVHKTCNSVLYMQCSHFKNNKIISKFS